MPRPATRKKGAYTRAEIQRRYRQRKKREQIDPKTAAKQQRRADRELQLAEKTIAASTALGSKLYGVIYCDPPWRFEPYSRETGMDRSAENHYPTLGLDGLKALNVPAAKDCVLFLWTTDPMLDAAIDLIRAWGFTRKATRIWIKDRLGTGYWHQNQAEFLLIATKGKTASAGAGRAAVANRPGTTRRAQRQARGVRAGHHAAVPERAEIGDVRPPATRGLGQLGQRNPPIIS